MTDTTTILAASGDSLRLPLATSGLSVGVGLIKPGEPVKAGDSLPLPLATSGLSVGVGLVKQEPAKAGDALPLPLAVVAFLFAPSIRAILCEPAFAAQRASGIPPSLQVLNPVETIGADMHLALVVALLGGIGLVLNQALRRLGSRLAPWQPAIA